MKVEIGFFSGEWDAFAIILSWLSTQFESMTAPKIPVGIHPAMLTKNKVVGRSKASSLIGSILDDSKPTKCDESGNQCRDTKPYH